MMESDRSLLAAIRAGDLTATELLLDRHRPWAVEFALRLGAGDQAEDLVHDALFALIERPPAELRNESLEPLLRCDLGHRIGRAKRAASRMPAFHPGSSLVDLGRGVSSVIGLVCEAERLREAMGQLQSREQRLIEWRFFEDLSFQEIGARTGRSASSARGGLSRAVASLRRVLEKEGSLR